jgi:hypothetical protein
MIIAITTQTAKSYTKQDTLRAAVRSLDFSVLHYDDENIIAAVDIAPEIPHAVLTDGETGLYLVDGIIDMKSVLVLLESASFTLIQSDIPFPILLKSIPILTPLRMQGISFR